MVCNALYLIRNKTDLFPVLKDNQGNLALPRVSVLGYLLTYAESDTQTSICLSRPVYPHTN